ncbi:MAG: hypothetical protein WCO52_00295 [bacterium]
MISALLSLLVPTAHAGQSPPAHAGQSPLVGAITPAGNFSSTGITGGLVGGITTIAGTAITVITLIAGVLAVVYLIWSGIQYITSAGNADKAKVARQGIINAVIGIAIIVATYFIIRVSIGIGNQIQGSDGATTPGTVTH